MFPTTIHVAVAQAIRNKLIPALHECGAALSAKAKEWEKVLKIGRTHLIDATPLALGQEIGGMARQLDRSVGRAGLALEAVLELPVGGTAVGSGINTHPQFARRVCEILAKETGIPFIEAVDHFEANAQRDGLVECHGQIRTIAATLFTVANNVRWLSSGPQTGFHEIALPDLQPGSSIMPGKVNPVMSESLMQVAARVIGNDAAIALCGAAGSQFQLNIMMPVMGHATLESIRLLERRDLGLHPPLPGRHDGQRADVQQRGRAQPGDGHRLESVYRLRAGRQVGQGIDRHRQDGPRALPREEDPSRRRAGEGARSLEDDPAGVTQRCGTIRDAAAKGTRSCRRIH